jgi:hypothetical protein
MQYLYLNDQKSFAVLNNIDIASLASDMGVSILAIDFDKVEIMKDLGGC